MKRRYFKARRFERNGNSTQPAPLLTYNQERQFRLFIQAEEARLGRSLTHPEWAEARRGVLLVFSQEMDKAVSGK